MENHKGKPQGRTGITSAEIGILLLFLFGAVFLLNMGTMYTPARSEAREKSCYANMRVILGAMEMYNLDHLANGKPLMLSNLDLEILISDRYLKSEPKCPGVFPQRFLGNFGYTYLGRFFAPPNQVGTYSIQGDFSKAGKIRCFIHETVE